MLFAFLAGGVVLNVLKEELPEERPSRFMPFALGAIAHIGNIENGHRFIPFHYGYWDGGAAA